ncbi:hypothetical protein BUALT_Bualt18G0087000 [Buddleja alternifolia]|uniref:Uncharacterized protein n=1 Tax=Buddleja alternifolia TaxID=168488 RepID=A0AAV6W993_9LAMI|nr:hypothetical protein BUALT_Bualt18G0087000 [Buddleja alternifolia]
MRPKPTPGPHSPTPRLEWAGQNLATWSQPFGPIQCSVTLMPSFGLQAYITKLGKPDAVPSSLKAMRPKPTPGPHSPTPRLERTGQNLATWSQPFGPIRCSVTLMPPFGLQAYITKPGELRSHFLS